MSHASHVEPTPLLIVVSGPSGVGKNAVCMRLFAQDVSLVHSVSATTRRPRPGEVSGVDYFFFSEEAFRRGIDTGMFLEWAEVHGHLYGTPLTAVEEHLRAGRSPVLNIDVQGGRSVKEVMPEALLIFLMPPDVEALDKRLRHRGTDSGKTMAMRLANAEREMKESRHYDYTVINGELEQAVSEVEALIRQCRS